jgi:DNA replication protein DnaC
MEPINKTLQSLYPSQSAVEALDSYNHIELTDEEQAEAILWRKQKKETEIRKQELEKKANENRKALTQTRWSMNQTNAFMQYQSNNLFKDFTFSLDTFNTSVFEMLVAYFSEDEKFISLATSLGISNPNLSKGICLAGNFGVGKTVLMKLFSKNQRQSFKVISAKHIADQFESDGEDSMSEFVSLYKNPLNDYDSFLQKTSGLCIDDLGTEDLKIHFGNRKNVIGDIIEKRYFCKNVGVLFHATTNLTAEQLKDFYGGRVTSRMREIFNFIELPGEDRRK